MGLILARRKGERILLRVAGIEIWITQMEIAKNRSRLHFHAPREVEVLREDAVEQVPCTAKCVGPNAKRRPAKVPVSD